MNKSEALERLIEIRDEADDLSSEAASLVREYFPTQYEQGAAYGAFNWTSSSNPYDHFTLDRLIASCEYWVEDEDEEWA